MVKLQLETNFIIVIRILNDIYNFKEYLPYFNLKNSIGVFTVILLLRFSLYFRVHSIFYTTSSRIKILCVYLSVGYQNMFYILDQQLPKEKLFSPKKKNNVSHNLRKLKELSLRGSLGPVINRDVHKC